ncbi:polyadenylate-binding protein 1-like isoform X3 [Anguilla anguilla]|uniref:polyadenylate-binding protein 1-like isoform X3 n=1 Tax=Anguilla anguilla TaxID=7936 RepID=UPI0015AA6AB9|nr:polyadenylate-binding protein 1-like isoform X3 [Anguilla anguilla]
MSDNEKDFVERVAFPPELPPALFPLPLPLAPPPLPEPLLQRGIPAPTQPQPHPLAHVQPPPPHRQQGLTSVHPSHENWSPPSCLKANPDPNCCLGVFGLSLYTTERDLREVFSKYGPISDVSIVYDQQSRRSRGFAFVYFENREDSKEAKERANGMELDGRRIRVDFLITKRPHTPTPGIYMGRPNIANPDPNCCLGVFGLSLYTTERDLREVFSKYGPISDVSIVYDQQSRRSRGFAFVYFENREDSKEAKERANGMELDGRRIRVDFLITKRPHTPTPGIYMGRPNIANPDPNCCLGVFGLSLYTTERDLREVFSKYGPISDVSIVYDQQSRRSRGFAFVYFENREDSKEAEERANGMELDGRRIRVDFLITKRPHTPTPGIYMGRPTYGGGAGGPSVSRRYSRDYYDRGYDRGYDRYDDRDYYRSYRRRSPSPYYSRGAYRSRSRSRSYSPRHY